DDFNTRLDTTLRNTIQTDTPDYFQSIPCINKCHTCAQLIFTLKLAILNGKAPNLNELAKVIDFNDIKSLGNTYYHLTWTFCKEVFTLQKTDSTVFFTPPSRIPENSAIDSTVEDIILGRSLKTLPELDLLYLQYKRFLKNQESTSTHSTNPANNPTDDCLHTPPKQRVIGTLREKSPKGKPALYRHNTMDKLFDGKNAVKIISRTASLKKRPATLHRTTSQLPEEELAIFHDQDPSVKVKTLPPRLSSISPENNTNSAPTPSPNINTNDKAPIRGIDSEVSPDDLSESFPLITLSKAPESTANLPAWLDDDSDANSDEKKQLPTQSIFT
ncbi:MAG: hypothetical protein L0Y61_08940, partial [Epsilonproteobacteria bacterium]|nr:hypothetical protein [Campylobacterota bacterium]